MFTPHTTRARTASAIRTPSSQHPVTSTSLTFAHLVAICCRMSSMLLALMPWQPLRSTVFKFSEDTRSSASSTSAPVTSRIHPGPLAVSGASEPKPTCGPQYPPLTLALEPPRPLAWPPCCPHLALTPLKERTGSICRCSLINAVLQRRETAQQRDSSAKDRRLSCTAFEKKRSQNAADASCTATCCNSQNPAGD